MKLLIAEEALIGRGGHWLEYINSIAKGCREAGDEVLIAANLKADLGILEQLQANPVFPRNAWSNPKPPFGKLGRLAQLYLHNKGIYKSAEYYLKEKGPVDFVFVPTILIDHILGWKDFACKHAGKDAGTVFLFFVNGLGQYSEKNKSIHYPKNQRTSIYQKAFKAMRPLVEAGKVRLGCETQKMAKEFSQFSGLPFEYLPHPVEFSPIEERPANNPLVISCFGFARYEKGSDLLQKAILKIKEEKPDFKAQFMIQWVNAFKGPDGETINKDTRLQKDSQVSFIETSLDSEQYHNWIKDTDIMVLPYRARSYYARVSRVAIEAAVSAMPMIYTADTWNADIIEKDELGAGVAFESENLDQLINAIKEAVNNFPSLKAKAIERKGAAIQHFSANHFRSLLNKQSHT